jgi:CO dehydrogenase nickel-insertion accessory protein CooC1
MKIQVLGFTGSGKTAVAWHIQKALHDIGFTDVVVIDPDEAKVSPNQDNRIRQVAVEDAHIEIVTVQASRSGKAVQDPPYFEDDRDFELGGRV